jgi:hypothetical protein
MKYCVFVFMMDRTCWQGDAEDPTNGCLGWYRIRIFLDRLPVPRTNKVWQGSAAMHFLLLRRFNFGSQIQKTIPSNFGSGEFLFY